MRFVDPQHVEGTSQTGQPPWMRQRLDRSNDVRRANLVEPGFDYTDRRLGDAGHDKLVLRLPHQLVAVDQRERASRTAAADDLSSDDRLACTRWECKCRTHMLQPGGLDRFYGLDLVWP